VVDTRHVRELELDDVVERLRAAGISEVRPLAGGASSLTYAAVASEGPVVVKVAPPGVPPVLNRDVLRQARIIRLLGPTPVPVPEVLWEDHGAPPDTPPLFVMSFLEGNSVEPLFDHHSDCAPEVMSDRLRHAAQTMAALHDLQPAVLGVEDEPVTGLGQEVDRWCSLLETVDQTPVSGWEDAAAALHDSLPAQFDSAIVHGDFRLGNLLAVGDRVTAVLDWEIWSVGDPRVDVGWFLLNCDPDTYRRRTPYGGATPPISELAAVYSAARGTHVPDLGWFQALASFKSAATWSLIVKHNRRRTSPDGDVESLVPVLPLLLANTRELLG